MLGKIAGSPPDHEILRAVDLVNGVMYVMQTPFHQGHAGYDEDDRQNKAQNAANESHGDQLGAVAPFFGYAPEDDPRDPSGEPTQNERAQTAEEGGQSKALGRLLHGSGNFFHVGIHKFFVVHNRAPL